jgi:hypothetical protein
MVYNIRDYCVFGLCPSSDILNKTTSGNWVEDTYSVVSFTPDLRYTRIYSCRYTDIGCRVIEVPTGLKHLVVRKNF